jgi:hypothetical protein
MLKQRQTDPQVHGCKKEQILTKHMLLWQEAMKNPRPQSKTCFFKSWITTAVSREHLITKNIQKQTVLFRPNHLAEQQEICCPKGLMVPNIGLMKPASRKKWKEVTLFR